MGFWKTAKKYGKQAGRGVVKGVKYGAKVTKRVVEVPLKLAEKTGEAAGNIVGGAGNIMKFLPYILIAVAAGAIYFLFIKGGATKTIGAVT